jgi:hypothetical protein
LERFAPGGMSFVVPMLMMDIRKVRMAMRQDRMRVLVRMRLVAAPVEVVGVLVVLVVNVAMRMRDGQMRMHVLMPLLQM